MTSSRRGYSPSREKISGGKTFWEKNLGKKFVGGKIFVEKNFWEHNFFGQKHFWDKFFGEKNLGEKSFIVIGSVVFEKRAINVSLIIIITKSINRHNCLGFSRRHQFFSFGGSPPLAYESDEVLLSSYWIR